MKFLEFTYINHNGEQHTYKVIPLSVEFSDNKLNYPGARESWNLKAFVLERSGVLRNVIRTFCIMRLRNVTESYHETR